MRNRIESSTWQTNLSRFGERNNMRPTRLEILGPDRELASDYWIEDGLLLTGIVLDVYGDRSPNIEIMLQAPAGTNKSHMTHTVAGVKRVELETSDGRDEVLEIEDREGAITIMRFESRVWSQDLCVPLTPAEK
jgi:hypothetical protein